MEELQPSSRSILTIVSLDLPAETSATESSTRTSISSAASKQSLPRFEDQPEDESWQTVSSQKPTGKKAVFFVGNLRNDMQEEDFKTFITKRCLSAGVSVVVHSVKLFSKSDNTVCQPESSSVPMEQSSSKAVCSGQPPCIAEHGALISTRTATPRSQTVT